MTIENKIKNRIVALAIEDGLSYNEECQAIKDIWGEGGLRGYGIFTSANIDFLHIEKIDELDIYDSDLDASKQAELDGIKIIHDIRFECEPFCYYNDTIIDTKENRKLVENIKKVVDK
jgi:hypothetical protein